MANRKNTFLLKRSNVVNKVPSLGDIQLGEIALNTADAKLFSTYTGGLSGATEIREIGWDRLSTISGGTVNGDVIINSDLTVTGDTQLVNVSGTSFYTDYIDFNLTAVTTHEEGRLRWDDDFKTLLVDTNQDISIQVGQQMYLRGVNKTGSQLDKGNLVFIDGALGNRPTISLATNSDGEIASRTIGFMTEDTINNAEGYVITSGIISDINTLPYSAGTELYLSTGGTYTNIIPISPERYVKVGIVVIQSATEGSIYADILSSFDLSEINNVKTSGLTNGDLILYDSGQELWLNSKTLNGDYTINGTLDITGDLNVTGTTFYTNITGTSIGVDYIDFNNTLSPLPADLEGRIYWDSDNGTLSLGMEGGNVVQQIGLEQYYYIKNQSGATISNGRVVRAAGTLGSSGRILGEYMIADGTIPPKFTLGIATENIVNGDDGYVTEFGLVRGIDASGALYGESWSAGTILYVSSTIPGGLTKVEPTAPDLKIEMAIVIDADSNGSIFVRPNRYPYIYDLQQVNYSAGTENNLDILQWNNSNQTWDKTNTPSFSGLTIYNNINHYGNYILDGNISQTGNYSVTGDTTINGDLGVTGTVNIGTLGTGTSINTLGIDSNGYIVPMENEIWTIELIDSQSVDFYAPYDLVIESITNIVNSPTIQIKDDGVTYTLGNTISVGSKITVNASTSSVINLNITI